MAQCRACGAAVEGSSCPYCGLTVTARPPASTGTGARTAGAGGDGELPCPRCGGSARLAARKLDGALVQGCDACGGLWIGAEELESLVEESAGPAKDGASPKVARADPVVKYLACPRCGSLMARRNYRRASGVIVDRCPAHGTWLDAGELHALREFVASGGLEAAAEAEREHERWRERASRLRRIPWNDTAVGGVGGLFSLDD